METYEKELLETKVSILLLAFNRPDVTKKVLTAIGRYAPRRLYLAVDGPRPGNTADEASIEQIKKVLAEWRRHNPFTQVTSLYRDTNLGCGKAVSSAITWFFEQEELGIILEDDCLPVKSFFTFCETLLYKYRRNEQIMHIGGTSFINNLPGTKDSYYFSKHVFIWGWATWRRAWQKYQYDMPRFAELLKLPAFKKYYDDDVFIKTQTKAIDTWDSQWVYTVLMNDGLSIVPCSNLVTNIGFDNDKGSHLHEKPKWYSGNTTELREQLQHPSQIVQRTATDEFVFRKVFQRGFGYRMKKALRQLFNK
jgi:hypothetical protein